MTFEAALTRLEESGADLASARRKRAFVAAITRALPRTWDQSVDPAVELLQSGRVRVSARTLERARIACWRYVDQLGSDIKDPKVAAVRTIICGLFPTVEETSYSLEFCGYVARNAGVPDDDLERMLLMSYEVSPP
jgi:hypothetical protein